jgi:hypothetical protein
VEPYRFSGLRQLSNEDVNEKAVPREAERLFKLLDTEA